MGLVINQAQRLMDLSSSALLSIQHRHTKRDERGRGKRRDALIGQHTDENRKDSLFKRSFDYQNNSAHLGIRMSNFHGQSKTLNDWHLEFYSVIFLVAFSWGFQTCSTSVFWWAAGHIVNLFLQGLLKILPRYFRMAEGSSFISFKLCLAKQRERWRPSMCSMWPYFLFLFRLCP